MIGRSKERLPDCREYLLSHPAIVHSLVLVFGMSAWIGINGIYVQLPLLVINAPEGWNLASYVVLAVQAANAGPLFYALAKRFLAVVDEAACIFALLTTGATAMGVLAFYHEVTVGAGADRYSLPMLLCVFLIATLGCTSSVLFMPYLRDADARYLISYFVGEGLSGVVPSVVALFQGVGGNADCRDFGNGTTIEIFPNPRFPSRDYFLLLFAVLLSSVCTFTLLRHLPSAGRDVTSVHARKSVEKHREGVKNILEDFGNSAECGNREISPTSSDRDAIEMGKSRTIYLRLVLCTVCFLGNGFLPAVQTYSCLPYGNVAFHLTVTLANIANPLACLLSFRFRQVHRMVLHSLTLLGASTSAYVIYLAAVSPAPPLQNSSLGVVIVVCVWILLTGVVSYLKLAITSKIRKKNGPDALIDVGIVMQLGSACGAILSFVLINYTHAFRQHASCTLL